MKNMFFIRRLIALPVVGFFLGTAVKGQGLKIGDTIPTNLLSQRINAPTPEFTSSDLRKKLVILQFWNTGCGACIKSLKQIDTLQKKFNNNIQFVLVSKESKKELHDFFASHKKIVHPKVPMITSDSALKKYFPHHFVPHHVWLGEGKRVIAITSGYNATVENITAYLQGKDISLRELSNQPQTDFDKPFIETATLTGRKMFYSYLMPAVDSILARAGQQKVSGSAANNRAYFNKVSVIDLFVAAFNKGGQQFQRILNNVIIEVKDSTPYVPPSNKTYLDVWKADHLYLYDILVPPESAYQLYPIMQAELQRLFPLRASIERRTVDCLTVVPNGDSSLLASKGGKPSTLIRKKPADSLWIFKNIPFKLAFSRLRNAFRYAGLELLDGTSYSLNVDLSFNADAIQPVDIIQLNEQLKKYGLAIVSKPSVVDILVIKDQ